MQFKDLGLVPELLKAAVDAGYETPSPIQEKAIPPVLLGQDLLACAQTGTGKTAAFAMPILQLLNAKHISGARHIRTLILTPTRELALQIHESFVCYAKYLKLKSYVIFGGVSQNPQVDALKRGTDILVATPGRLLDLIGQGHVDLSGLEIFVLDEADRMLDMGFIHDIKRVLTYLPAKKQTLLFSATMPSEIEELVNKLLCKPAKIYVTPPSTTVQAISQSIYFVDKKNKQFLLANLLDAKKINSALVFTRTKHGANNVVRALDGEGIPAMAIHGNKSQNARQAALSSFKDGKLRVLVATDIAARGIDINELEYVFNYDLPEVPETYVHRIGRTGRAGQNGIAISFCCFDEKPLLFDIEKLISQPVPIIDDHKWPMQILVATPKDKPGQGSRGRNDGRSRQNSNVATPKSADAKSSQLRANTNSRTSKAFENPNSKKPNPKMDANFVKTPLAAKHTNKPIERPKPSSPAKSMSQSSPKSFADTAQRNLSAKKPREKPMITGNNSQNNSSLNVVSRKTPAQKFASFDDYMNAKK